MNQSAKPKVKAIKENKVQAFCTPEKRSKPRNLSPGKKPLTMITDDNMAEMNSKIPEFKLF